MRRRELPKHCSFETDRHGKPRVRFRKGKISRYLDHAGAPWTPAFMEAYGRALADVAATTQAIGADRTIPHSVGALIKSYLASDVFTTKAAETQRTRRNILERFAKAHGDKPLYSIAPSGDRIMLLKRERMQKFVNDKSKTPFAQRNFLNTLHAMFKWAMKEGRSPDDPTLGVVREKVSSTGYRTWSEAEIERFEATHPIGSKARLAFALLLYTGQRRSDVVKLGKSNMHGDLLTLDQQKTEGGEAAHLEIPVHPKLVAIIAATSTVGVKTFLVTRFGKPYKAPGFGNWFRELCDAADCPLVSAHGLRKATARRLAEIGCSAHQIASITGHASLSEVERYTKAADRKRLAREAMAKLVEGGW
jgi:integrase